MLADIGSQSMGAVGPHSERPSVIRVLNEFVSAASFESIAKITSSAWAEHAPFAMWLVDTLRPQCLVELGVFRGFSYLAMCQAVSRFSPRTRCYGIDNWSGDEHNGFYGEEVFEQLKKYHDPLYSDFSELVRSSFDDAVSQFADGSIDLLHIDGRHFYQDVKHDFDTWRPKLSERSVVLFHDTNVRDRGFGVWNLWEQLSLHYPSFEFIHGYGLGVLGYGRRVPASLERLFAAARDGEAAGAVRSVYFRLGVLYSQLERYEEVKAQIENPGAPRHTDLVFEPPAT